MKAQTEKDVKNMLKKNMTQQKIPIIIDLTKIEGDGAFPCPKCGTIISPEDETEEVYKIVNTKVVNDELVELTIVCDTCGTQIRLAGFQPNMEDLPSD